MSATSASNYARGTAAWQAVADSQGEAAADAQWQAAINAERNQTPLDTSTWSIFGSQLYNDPFAAPIEQANKVLGNTITDAFKNPFFLFAAVALAAGAFFWFGGMTLLKKR